MITKRIAGRKDGHSSPASALEYGQGLGIDRETGEIRQDKSHRTRLGGFDIIDNGIFTDRPQAEMAQLIELAAIEMKTTQDLNPKVKPSAKMAHMVFSYGQQKPTEAVLMDTENKTLAALGLNNHQFATFLHNDNGHWHLHIFASQIDKDTLKGNPLWQDQKKRDHVCREVELKHGLHRDPGYYVIQGQNIVVNKDRDPSKSGNSRAAQKHGQTLTFGEWADQSRLGDKLKTARSWAELHQLAARYGVEIERKGHGYIVKPNDGQPGAAKLSALGIKARQFGDWQPAPADLPAAQVRYAPEAAPLPVEAQTPARQANREALYKEYGKARARYATDRADALATIKADHAKARAELGERLKAELADLKARHKSELLGRPKAERDAAKARHHAELSLAKMAQVEARQAQSKALADDRARRMAAIPHPGTTFADYLRTQAVQGSGLALDALRAAALPTDTDRAKHAATLAGERDQVRRHPVTQYKIERDGTVIYELGQGRQFADLAGQRRLALNPAAQQDADTLTSALRFAQARFGSQLTLTGPDAFRTAAVRAAVAANMRVTFTNPADEALRQRLEKERSHHVIRATANRTTRVPPAPLRNRLHTLPERDLVRGTERAESVLPRDVSGHMVEQREAENRQLRRPAPDAGVTQNSENIRNSQAIENWIGERNRHQGERGQLPHRLTSLDEVNRLARTETGLTTELKGVRTVDKETSEKAALFMTYEKDAWGSKTARETLVLPVTPAQAAALEKLDTSRRYAFELDGDRIKVEKIDRSRGVER